MTELERRLATLAAAFTKERAPGLLGRMTTPGAAEVVRLAGRLATAPRIERLRAFAAAIGADAAAGRAAAQASAAHERAAVARVLVALAAGEPPRQCSPLLVRAARERLRG